MNLLIVDDDTYMLQEISDILTPWAQQENIQLILAEDGASGLEQALLTPPDLLITDVQMPRMDGLTLAENVQKLVPDCLIVFLSNYSDTLYLKKAIHLRAVEYLEKPILPDELLSLLEILLENLRKKRNETTAYQEHICKMNDSASQILIQLWGQMLCNKTANLDSLRSQCRQYQMEYLYHSVYRCLLLRLAPSQNLSVNLPVIENVKCILPDLSHQQMQLVILCADSSSDLSDSLIHTFWDQLKNSSQVLCLGVSPIITNYAQVCRIWQITHNAFEQLIFDTKPQIIFFRHMQMNHECEYYAIISRILSEISALNIPPQKLHEFLLQEENGTLKQIDNIYVSFCHLAEALHAYSAENYLDFHHEYTLFELYQKIFDCIDEYALENLMKDWITKLKQKGLGDERTTRSIIAYIQANYSNPNLDLDTISKFTGYSKSRICVIFKSKTNLTITDYINSIRINAACELLQYTDKTIKQIATTTGFTNNSYFCKVFKAITNQTPKKYRSNIK